MLQVAGLVRWSLEQLVLVSMPALKSRVDQSIGMLMCCEAHVLCLPPVCSEVKETRQ